MSTESIKTTPNSIVILVISLFFSKQPTQIIWPVRSVGLSGFVWPYFPSRSAPSIRLTKLIDAITWLVYESDVLLTPNAKRANVADKVGQCVSCSSFICSTSLFSPRFRVWMRHNRSSSNWNEICVYLLKCKKIKKWIRYAFTNLL